MRSFRHHIIGHPSFYLTDMRFIRLFIIAVFSLFSYSSASAFCQLDISKVHFQKISEYLEQGDCTTAIAVLDTITIDSNVAPLYFYFRGVAEDMCGNKYLVLSCLEKCLNEFDKYGYKDETYLDATIRLIDFYRNSEGGQHRRAELARNALAAPKSVLKDIH